MYRMAGWSVWACFVLAAATAFGQAKEEKPEVVVEGLINPCGIAIQPETGVIFVADSGAGRIVRIVDGKIEPVVVGFPLDEYGKGPTYKIGPLGLAFLDKDTLVVGGGELPDTEEMIRVYKLPAPDAEPLQADAAETKLGPLEVTDELKAEGNYYGVAVTKTAIYATANGDDTKGWVVRAELDGTKIGELERWLATKEAVDVDAPVAITISPRGEIVVGQMGEINVPHDSLLSFYGPKTGKLLLNLETGLYDITGLVYSPKGHLYAVDFAWMAPEEGGLFRLDAEGEGADQKVKAVKIAPLDKPTAMAFGTDGALYVTILGSGEENAPNGKLLKFAPGL